MCWPWRGASRLGTWTLSAGARAPTSRPDIRKRIGMETREGGGGGLCGLAWCERHDPIENGRWEGGVWSRWSRWSISISHYTKKRTGPPEQIPTPLGPRPNLETVTHPVHGMMPLLSMSPPELSGGGGGGSGKEKRRHSDTTHARPRQRSVIGKAGVERWAGGHVRGFHHDTMGKIGARGAHWLRLTAAL